MSIYDFHRRTMCPALWKDEQNLRFSPRAQLSTQLERRFPKATKAFLVGELVSNYYTDASPMDVLVLVPDNVVKEYQEEAQVVSGYKLRGTQHPVFFHVMSDQTSPEVIADKFGVLYNVGSGMWTGRRSHDPSALLDPDALMRYIRWRAYRVKDSDEPYPYRWRVLPQAYTRMEDDQRQEVLGHLRDIIERLRLNARKIAGAYRDEMIWDSAGKLELLLQEEALDEDIMDFVAANNIPMPVLKAFYNMYRYKDVLDILETTERKMRKQRESEDASKGVILQMASTQRTAPEELFLGTKRYRRLD